jgi:hypothetical protein
MAVTRTSQQDRHGETNPANKNHAENSKKSEYTQAIKKGRNRKCIMHHNHVSTAN